MGIYVLLEVSTLSLNDIKGQFRVEISEMIQNLMQHPANHKILVRRKGSDILKTLAVEVGDETYKFHTVHGDIQDRNNAGSTANTIKEFTITIESEDIIHPKREIRISKHHTFSQDRKARTTMNVSSKNLQDLTGMYRALKIIEASIPQPQSIAA